ncbi:MAG: hypothetical protein ACI4AK_03325 [Lepagella sp.]
MKQIFRILPWLLLLISCREDLPIDGSVQKLNITFADIRTRSEWSDLTDTDGNVKYVWESNSNMLTAIKHGTGYVPFYEALTSAGQYHTMTQFETVDAERSKIKLQTLYGVKYDLVDGNYDYPVAAGDNMYCIHPVGGNTDIVSSAEGVYVDMHLPGTFRYEERLNDLSTLADYSYVYTSTTLQEVNDNNVIANTSHFNSVCAIIRYNIINSITSDIIITGVKMETNDKSLLFPDKLRLEAGAIAEQSDKTGYYSGLATDINSVTIPKGEKGVFYNLCFPVDGNFNNVPLKFTIDTNYLTYQLRLDSDVITNHKFEAGKIYTFNFDLGEKEVKLNTIEISECTTYNIDNAESVNIVITPNSEWDQTDDTPAQMVFVSLGMTTEIDGKEYEVLWATSNLGAREPIETGNHYAWGEVEKKEGTLYSPEGYTAGTVSGDIQGTEYDAVKQYLGAGYWMWTTPTKEMWDDIINNCEWKWQTVKISEDAPDSEENLNFDASVWKVTKKDEGGNLVGVIYLPITGYSGLDSKSGTYQKVNKAVCYYWTSTPTAGSGAGATETSWAFSTSYYIDTEGAGNGHMSDPTMQECERYNGYSIRPILLKEKN